MSNIRDFTSRVKGENGKFFSAPRSNSGERRIDYRFAGGDRTSLPYSHLVDVTYNAKHAGHDGQEVIGLDYTAYWMVVIAGKNLLPLYESLQGHDVIWVREPESGEEAEGDEAHITSIEIMKLTDPALGWESLQAQKKAVFGEM